MGLQNITWRKLPRNAVSDIRIQSVAMQLPQELKPAALLFYVVAICTADDDGVFDIDDGFTFSIAMQCGTPDDVFQIADLFVLRKLIVQVEDDSSQYMLVDWESPFVDSRFKSSLTAEQRRQAVLNKMQQNKKIAKSIKKAGAAPKDTYRPEPRFSSPAPQPAPLPSQEQLSDYRFSQKKSEKTEPFFPCPENDKKSNSVATGNLNDSFVISVATDTDRQTDKTDRGTDNTEQTEKTHTHTDAQSVRETPDKSGSDAPAEEKTETETETENRNTDNPDIKTELQTETKNVIDIRELQETVQKKSIETETANEADSVIQSDGKEVTKAETLTGKGDCGSVLKSFFSKKNPAGFADVNAELQAIQEITKRVDALKDTRNSPEIIVCQYIRQFERLVTGDGYYKNAPLLASYMIKPGIWARITQQAAKVLSDSGGTGGKWFEECQKWRAEAEKDREKLGVDNITDALYINSGINPQDPNRIAKLMEQRKVVKRE